MPVGDQSRTGPLPKLTATEVGQPTELSVSVRWAKVEKTTVEYDYIRNVPPGFNVPDDCIVFDGKLYRLRRVDHWKGLLPESGTATVTWNFGGLSGTIAQSVPFEATAASSMSLTLPWVIPAEIATVDTSHDAFAVNIKVTIDQQPETPFEGPFTGNNKPTILADAVPSLVEWGLSEGNPSITPGAPFILGSLLKANPVFEGTVGAPIQSVLVKFDATARFAFGYEWYLSGGLTIPGGGLPLTKTGTFNVGAIVTDTRGRTAGFNTTITVEEYTPPSLTFAARRVDANDLPDDAGNHIRVDVTSQIHHLAGLNVQQLRVFTRPRGGSGWTARNVIDPPSLTYTGTFTLTGEYDPLQAWDVRIDLQDVAGVLQDVRTVASSGIILDSDRGHVAIGQSVDPDGPPVQLKGPVKVYGGVQATGLPRMIAAGTAVTSSSGVAMITLPVGFTATPVITATPEGATIGALYTRLQSVSATSAQAVITEFSGSNYPRGIAGVLVHWIAIQP